MISEKSPCGTCKYKDQLTVLEPCWSCIDNIELALHKQEVDFVHYTQKEKEEKNANS